MIATLNELESLAKRALAGRGAPPGLDEDGAAATAWLEARGLPALPALLAQLAQLDRMTAVLGPLPGEGARRDAGGRSAVLLCGALVDLAVLQASAGPLTVANLRDPLFLLPLAERRRRAGWRFRIAWGPGQGARIEDDGVSLLDPGAELATPEAVTVSIACRQAAPAEAPPRGPLEAHRRRTLARGLAVEDGLWRRLQRHGASGLVPASAESRRRGAGAAASDNE